MGDVLWKTLTVREELSLDYPESGRWSLQDNGTTLRIDLEDGTAVFTSRYPRKQGGHSETLPEFLGRMALEFVDIVLRQKNATNEGLFSQTIVEDGGDGLNIVEVRLPLPESNRWLIRTYGRRGCDDFQIIHWNGYDDQLEDVVRRIFDSFRPLRPAG